MFLSTATLFVWARGVRSFARDLTDFLVTFSYPGSIYQGPFKLVIYTVFPAAFIVLIPVDLIRRPELDTTMLLGMATIIYAVMACGVFAMGLRRYRRGESPRSE